MHAYTVETAETEPLNANSLLVKCFISIAASFYDFMFIFFLSSITTRFLTIYFNILSIPFAIQTDMENEVCKNQRTSGNRIRRDEEMQTTGKRNPGILRALDAVHRSLLNNNLKYEGKMRRAICCVCFVFVVAVPNNNLNAI